MRPEVTGGKDEIMKTLGATKEMKEFQAVPPKVVDVLHSYKEFINAFNEKADCVRAIGQPRLDDKVDVVHNVWQDKLTTPLSNRRPSRQRFCN